MAREGLALVERDSPYRPATGRWPLRGDTARLPTWVWPAVSIVLLGAMLAAGAPMQEGRGTGRPGVQEVGVAEPSAPVGLTARHAAFRCMQRALDVQRQQRRARGLAIDLQLDPNDTGLIGLPYSPITTTYGELSAKRTATNPQWASRLVEQFETLAIGRGDAVLAGFSASFPGLNVAVWCAASALGARLLAISSVSASMYGANDPRWTWIDMEQALWSAGVLPGTSLGYTLGGDGDTGEGLDPEGVALLLAAASRNGVRLHRFASAQDAVRWRIQRYQAALQAAGGPPAKLYVNVGGATGSVGPRGAITLKPGLNLPGSAQAGGGVAQWALHRQIPVLHLLSIEQLARRWGVSVDPLPLPSEPPL